MSVPQEKVPNFLNYIKQTFNPELLYYPGSGADKLPKKIFGKHGVIHLSLKSDEKHSSYFKGLGDGIKIFGHINESPIADNSVDAIYLNIRPSFDIMVGTIDDFKRVLKEDGIVAICHRNTYNRDKWINFKDYFKDFDELPVPVELESGKSCWGFGNRTDEVGEYVESEEEMKKIVFDKEKNPKGDIIGFEHIWDFAIFRKTGK